MEWIEKACNGSIFLYAEPNRTLLMHTSNRMGNVPRFSRNVPSNASSNNILAHLDTTMTEDMVTITNVVYRSKKLPKCTSLYAFYM